jgi:putative transposase
MQRLWGRKVSDLSYGDFVEKLLYISQKYNTSVVKIGRFDATSQVCHCCGYKNIDTKNLSVRTWICPNCGANHDRDINAAINILLISKGKGISLGRSDNKTSTPIGCGCNH